jgi:hypothetical protein
MARRFDLGCTSSRSSCYALALSTLGVLAVTFSSKAEDITFSISNGSPYAIQVEFYSQNYSRGWPGGGNAWPQQNNATKDYSLSCSGGETICYGAWTMPNHADYWGVNMNNKTCKNCCAVCGSGGNVSFELAPPLRRDQSPNYQLDATQTQSQGQGVGPTNQVNSYTQGQNTDVQANTQSYRSYAPPPINQWQNPLNTSPNSNNNSFATSGYNTITAGLQGVNCHRDMHAVPRGRVVTVRTSRGNKSVAVPTISGCPQ